MTVEFEFLESWQNGTPVWEFYISQCEYVKKHKNQTDLMDKKVMLHLLNLPCLAQLATNMFAVK
jgi:hypothetical protein